MSVSYQAVGWNRQKKIYDGVMLAGSVSFLTVFSLVSWATQPALTVETALIRAFGSLAFVLLHVILVIDSGGARANVWLTGPGGAPVAESFLSLVAEPVELSGRLMAFDDQLVLEVDPATVTWIH